ncbi:Signal peptidase complex catalytic subunit SEC11A [Pelomyxa schiedti]|nr:Signal peptidase complex catalytic subunit SEC11A [Pelomyxa schiedti]
MHQHKVVVIRALSLLFAFVLALAAWNLLRLATNTELPVLVVQSSDLYVISDTGRMEATFHRGDLLLVTHYQSPYTEGDIIVFKVEGISVPIVHRIMRSHINDDGSTKFLTKGDSHFFDDRGLYAPQGELFIYPNQILGRVTGYIPFVGYIALLFLDYPMQKKPTKVTQG